MFNATLAGHHHRHHLRPDYLSNSRGSSRAGSRFDMHEVGRSTECRVLNPAELEERVQMLHDGQDGYGAEEKSCYSKYQACLYLSVVFSIIAATIVIIVYVALGGLRGGGM